MGFTDEEEEGMLGFRGGCIVKRTQNLGARRGPWRSRPFRPSPALHFAARPACGQNFGPPRKILSQPDPSRERRGDDSSCSESASNVSALDSRLRISLHCLTILVSLNTNTQGFLSGLNYCGEPSGTTC